MPDENQFKGWWWEKRWGLEVGRGLQGPDHAGPCRVRRLSGTEKGTISMSS